MAKRTWFIYAINPIDYWAGWLTIEQAVEAIFRDSPGGSDQMVSELWRGNSLAIRALQHVTWDHSRWDGDGKWRVIPFLEQEWLYAIKQQDDGRTFFVSPYPLDAILVSYTIFASSSIILDLNDFAPF